MKLFKAIFFIVFGLTSGFVNSNPLDTMFDKTRLVLEESNIPPALLQQAEAVVVVPNLIKGGLVIAVQSGHGILLMRDEKTGEWSYPSFVKITGGSLGLQLGVQSSDLILVVRNRRGIEGIMDGTATLGATGSIALGPVGGEIGAATDFSAEIYSYSLSKGIFLGISLDGASLSIDEVSNTNFYGRVVKPEDIFAGKVIATSESLKKFKELLTERSK